MESVKEKKGLFKRFTSMCVRVMERWLPDPFIFCALLTFLVFGGALIFTKASFMGVIGYWVDGFWSLLAIFNANGISSSNRTCSSKFKII